MAHDNILITGSNGLLGRSLCQHLRQDNSLHALVHRMPSDPLEGVTYDVIDLSKRFDTQTFPDNVNTVIHLAQSSQFRDFPESVMNVFDVNIGSTALLLDYAYKVGAKHFIYASSGGVYSSGNGGSGNGAFKENALIDPGRHLGYYLGSKLCGEILAQNYASLMTVSILRFFFMYGRRQKRSMLLPRLVDNIRAGKPVQLQGKEGLCINPIHVADAAACFDQLIGAKKSRTINIAGSETFSLKQIALMIGDALGKKPVFETVKGEPRNLVADISLMKECLAEPKIFFEEGVKDIL